MGTFRAACWLPFAGSRTFSSSAAFFQCSHFFGRPSSVGRSFGRFGTPLRTASSLVHFGTYKAVLSCPFASFLSYPILATLGAAPWLIVHGFLALFLFSLSLSLSLSFSCVRKQASQLSLAARAHHHHRHHQQHTTTTTTDSMCYGAHRRQQQQQWK